MPLFTSNSSQADKISPWLLSWGLGFILTLLICFLLSHAAKRIGYQAQIIHDRDTWAMQRERLGDLDGDEVALVGQSRLLMGFSMKTAKSMFPNKKFVQLAVDGAEPGPTAIDLASDSDFRGLLVLSISFFPESKYDQSSYLEHYYNAWSLSRKLDRNIRTELQQGFVLFNPRLNPIWQAYSFLSRGQLLDPSFYLDNRERGRIANWSTQAGRRIIESRVAAGDQEWMLGLLRNKASQNWYTQRFTNWFKNFEPHVQALHARGGHLVYLRMPYRVPGKTGHQLEKKLFKPIFDEVAGESEASLIHFLDLEELAELETPDGSHLTYQGSLRFTTVLLETLAKKGLLPPGGRSIATEAFKMRKKSLRGD